MTARRGDRLHVDLTDVDQVDVRIVDGEVNVTASSATDDAAVRVEVDVRRGPEGTVEVHGGTVVVEQQPVRTLAGLLDGNLAVEAAVTLVVPEGMPVRVRTVSADVFVAGTTAATSINTVSGGITATGLDGATSLKTVSGDLEVQGVGGEVRVSTVSGDLTISGGDPEEVTARTVSGDLTFDLDEVPDVDCTTVSGNVAMRLPADAGVDLDVVSMSGHLETTFPDHGLDATRRRLRGLIGGGGRRLAVRTTSGHVTVLRRSTTAAGRRLDR